VNRFVLDVSVAANWGLVESQSSQADAILRRLTDGDRALAPSIWMFEVANFIAKSLRGGHMSPDQAAEFSLLVKTLPIEIAHEMLARIVDAVTPVATAYQLTVYDAAYLELALREGIPLATADRGLAIAAGKAGVPLV